MDTLRQKGLKLQSGKMKAPVLEMSRKRQAAFQQAVRWWQRTLHRIEALVHQSILAQAPKVNHTEHICLFLQYACNNTAAGWKITWESTTFGCQMANIAGVPNVSEPMMCHRVLGAHQTESQIMMGLNFLTYNKKKRTGCTFAHILSMIGWRIFWETEMNCWAATKKWQITKRVQKVA